MSEHTPGPWSLEGGDRSAAYPGVLPRWSLWHHWQNDTRGMVGAGVVTGGSQTVAYLNAEDANARLIAAAPELLAALEEIIRCADDESEAYSLDKEIEFDASLVAARAAILRARGGKPEEAA